MAELSATRAAAIAAVAATVVGGAVGAGAAMVASTGPQTTTASASAAGGLATATVVRTNLTTSVQVGGSIGYGGSYAVAVPSGAGAQEVTQAHEALAEDQQAVSADKQAQSDAAAADAQATSADETDVETDQSTLGSDQAKRSRACAGKRRSSPACTQDRQTVGQDRTQLTQAEQQLGAAELTATRDRDQNQAKVQSDQTKLEGDQTTLSLLDANALNPGTTFTWLPKVGQIIRQDRPVYAVSNQPVPLLYGSIAAYRAFYVGMSDGADVGELTHDLISLGYGARLLQSNHYSWATAAAVERWQRALELPATGEILLGAVVFEPGPIRVTSVAASVGSPLGGGGGAGGGGGGDAGGGGGGGGGTVLTATSTTPIVTVALNVTQEYLVKPGDVVSIVLPDGTTVVGGHIETVGTVATCPGGGGVGSGTGASSADQSPCSSSPGSSSGASTNATATVTVTIALDRSPRGAALDQAPVNVEITSQRADHILAAPVNALLALQGGGFGVDVVSGHTSHLVGVTTGLYSDTLVQISGSGITAGTRVQVPSS